MERQGLVSPVGEADYGQLYRDLQPGHSEYWHGFGKPPELREQVVSAVTAVNPGAVPRRFMGEIIS